MDGTAVTDPSPTGVVSPLAAGHDYLVVEPDGGERLKFLGDSTMRLKLAAPSDAIAFYEYVSEPGVAGAPQHIHHGHDETFFVIEGRYEFTIGARCERLGPGAFLSVPRGTPHSFRNTGDTAGRIVGTFSPAAFANYFRELAAIIDTTGTVPDHDAWVELYGRYDTDFHESENPM